MAESSRENRCSIKTTRLPGRIDVSDRNRQDFRFVRGDYSFRYRNRFTMEREFVVREYRFSPYLQGEIYFDSRFRTWNRQRFGGGVVLPFSKPPGPAVDRGFSIRDHTSLDVYYTWQINSRSSPHRVDALGASLVFSFWAIRSIRVFGVFRGETDRG